MADKRITTPGQHGQTPRGRVFSQPTSLPVAVWSESRRKYIPTPAGTIDFESNKVLDSDESGRPLWRDLKVGDINPIAGAKYLGNSKWELYEVRAGHIPRPGETIEICGRYWTYDPHLGQQRKDTKGEFRPIKPGDMLLKAEDITPEYMEMWRLVNNRWSLKQNASFPHDIKIWGRNGGESNPEPGDLSENTGLVWSAVVERDERGRLKRDPKTRDLIYKSDLMWREPVEGQEINFKNADGIQLYRDLQGRLTTGTFAGSQGYSRAKVAWFETQIELRDMEHPDRSRIELVGALFEQRSVRFMLENAGRLIYGEEPRYSIEALVDRLFVDGASAAMRAETAKSRSTVVAIRREGELAGRGSDDASAEEDEAKIRKPSARKSTPLRKAVEEAVKAASASSDASLVSFEEVVSGFYSYAWHKSLIKDGSYKLREALKADAKVAGKAIAIGAAVTLIAPFGLVLGPLAAIGTEVLLQNAVAVHKIDLSWTENEGRREHYHKLGEWKPKWHDVHFLGISSPINQMVEGAAGLLYAKVGGVDGRHKVFTGAVAAGALSTIAIGTAVAAAGGVTGFGVLAGLAMFKVTRPFTRVFTESLSDGKSLFEGGMKKFLVYKTINKDLLTSIEKDDGINGPTRFRVSPLTEWVR